MTVARQFWGGIKPSPRLSRAAAPKENLVFAKLLITAPAEALLKTPVALKHDDSVFCWCDPLVELNDNGREIVVHKEVTWN